MKRRPALWFSFAILAILLGGGCSDSPVEGDDDTVAPLFLSPATLPEYACTPYAVVGDLADTGSGVAFVALFLDDVEIDREDFACPEVPDTAHFILTVGSQRRVAPVEVKLLAGDCAGNVDSMVFPEVTFLDGSAGPEISSWSLGFEDLGETMALSLTVSVGDEGPELDFALLLDDELVYAFQDPPGVYTHLDVCEVGWGWSEATLEVTNHCGVTAVGDPIAPPACHGRPRIISPEDGTIFCEPQPTLLIAVEIEVPCDDPVAVESVTLFHEGLAWDTDHDGSDGWRFFFNLDYVAPMETCFMARAVYADEVFVDSEEICITLDLPALELVLVNLDPATQRVTVRADPHCLPQPVWYGWASPGAQFYPADSGFGAEVEIHFPVWSGEKRVTVIAQDAEQVIWEAEIEIELE